MKKLLALGIIVMIPFLVKAQVSPLSGLMDKYYNQPGFESSEIMPGSMSFDWEQSIKDSPVRDLMNQIESVRILKYKPQAEDSDQEKIWKKMQKASSDDLYTEIATVSADKVKVHLLIMRGPEGTTRELSMIAKNEEGLMMMTMTGKMDFSSLFTPENLRELREMGEYMMKNKTECPHNKQ